MKRYELRKIVEAKSIKEAIDKEYTASITSVELFDEDHEKVLGFSKHD